MNQPIPSWLTKPSTGDHTIRRVVSYHAFDPMDVYVDTENVAAINRKEYTTTVWEVHLWTSELPLLVVNTRDACSVEFLKACGVEL